MYPTVLRKISPHSSHNHQFKEALHEETTKTLHPFTVFYFERRLVVLCNNIRFYVKKKKKKLQTVETDGFYDLEHIKKPQK